MLNCFAHGASDRTALRTSSQLIGDVSQLDEGRADGIRTVCSVRSIVFDFLPFIFLDEFGGQEDTHAARDKWLATAFGRK